MPYTDPFSPSGSAFNIAPTTALSNLSAAANNTRLAELTNAVNQAAQQAANAGRLGPQGQQIQSNLLTNLGNESAGILDPQTEAMLRQGINESFGAGAGFGVDSPALAAAYRRGTGKTIEQTQADAQKRYESLLASNPSAPIFNMGDLYTNPATVASTASSEAARQLADKQFYEKLSQSNQQFADNLALEYYRANLASQNRGGGGGGVSRIPSAAEYNSRPGGGTAGGGGYTVNPFTGALEPTNEDYMNWINQGAYDEGPSWYDYLGGYSNTGAYNYEYDPIMGGYVDTASGGVYNTPAGTDYLGFTVDEANTPAVPDYSLANSLYGGDIYGGEYYSFDPYAIDPYSSDFGSDYTTEPTNQDYADWINQDY